MTRRCARWRAGQLDGGRRACAANDSIQCCASCGAEWAWHWHNRVNRQGLCAWKRGADLGFNEGKLSNQSGDKAEAQPRPVGWRAFRAADRP